MKYLALDIGNVLCHIDMESIINDISETFNITLEDASSFLKDFQALHDLGCTTLEKELKHSFNVKSQVIINKIARSWSRSIIPDQYVISMIDRLIKEHNVEVALLSNIGIEHAQLTNRHLQILLQHSTTIKHFSCYVGARKPTSLFYQSFLLQYPQYTGCLYVDDLEENLNASKPFGFKTLKFDLSIPFYSSPLRDPFSITKALLDI